jgi:hypothetical protein
LVSNLAADLRPRPTLKIDVGKLLTVGVAHDETVGRDFGRPRRREASSHRISFVIVMTRAIA